MAELTPRERRHQKTKQAILQAAREIISEKGVAGLSLREVADRIDYSPAGLYEYFNSKDEIIAAVSEEGFERLSAYLNRVPTDLSPAKRLLELGVAYIDFARHNPEHFMLIFTWLPPKKILLIGSVDSDTPYGILRQAVEAFMQAEGISLPGGRTVDDLAYILWAHVHGMAMLQQTVFRHDGYEFGSLDHWALEVLSRGLKAE